MNRRTKKPVLLLHGALGCASDFAPLQTALNGKLPSVALDFPGHGQLAASNPERFSIEDFAETVHRYSAGTEPLDIFGYSMGGYVALYFASLYPGMVNRVFTLGAKLEWTPEGGAREAARLDPGKIAEKVPFFAVALAQKHGAGLWEHNMRRTARLLQTLGEAPLLDARAFSRIDAQVCIARGDKDVMVTESECEAAAGQIGKGRYLSLEDQPHPLDQCNLQMLARELTQFFADGN